MGRNTLKSGDYAIYRGSCKKSYGRIGIIINGPYNLKLFRFLDNKVNSEYSKAEYYKEYDAFNINFDWLEYSENLNDVIDF